MAREVFEAWLERQRLTTGAGEPADVFALAEAIAHALEPFYDAPRCSAFTRLLTLEVYAEARAKGWVVGGRGR